MRTERWLLGVLALLGVAAFAPSASAFCRTTTVGVSADFNPRAGVCWDRGLPLWWKNSCVSYNLHRDGSRQISYDDASRIIAESFTKWTGASCPTDGSGGSRVSIDVRDLGPVNCALVQYNSDFGNQHVIVFRDTDWPHNDANNTLALTTVTFNPDTGEIYDADMEVNTAQNKMSVTDPVPENGYDFASVMTHEAGHFLGLAHSGDPRATMYAHYNPGSTVMRNLGPDDNEGICSVYPPSGARAVATSVDPSGYMAGEPCDATPRKGFTTECKTAKGGGGSTTSTTPATGCGKSSVAPVDARDGVGALALAAATALATRGGRRRRGSRRDGR